MTHAYYSILYAQLNVATQERLAIGLVLVGETENVVLVDYSRRKLKVVSELIGQTATRNLKWALRGLVNAREQLIDEAASLFGKSSFDDSVFSQSYLTYLSRYSTNLLQVDPPRRIELPANEVTFDLLYNKDVDTNGRAVAGQQSTERRFRDIKSRETVKRHFRPDVKIDETLYAGLRFPVRVDLAGQNERLTVAKLIATDRPARYITDDAHAFQSLLSQTSEAKHFVVASEPNKATAPRQHFLWQNIREAFSEDYVDLSEFGKIEEYAREHNVTPLGDSLEEE